MIHYRWHPLYGRKARRIQVERRASGEFVHVELTPASITILPAWKVDPVYCSGLKVGTPQVSLSALCELHELLIACESRLVSSDGNAVTQETHDGIAGTADTTELAPRPHHGSRTSPLQLQLVLEDVRLRGMSVAERQAVLGTLARFLLEAGGVATPEVGDDHA